MKNLSIEKDRFCCFDEQIEMFALQSKKLFVKMDIEGNEYDTLPDLLEHVNDITGIALEIHFSKDQQISQALRLMKMLDRDFLLVHVHGNNCNHNLFCTKNSTGHLTRVLELSYINKRLVQSFELSPDQSHPTPLDMPNSPEKPEVVFSILNY